MSCYAKRNKSRYAHAYIYIHTYIRIYIHTLQDDLHRVDAMLRQTEQIKIQLEARLQKLEAQMREQIDQLQGVIRDREVTISVGYLVYVCIYVCMCVCTNQPVAGCDQRQVSHNFFEFSGMCMYVFMYVPALRTEQSNVL